MGVPTQETRVRRAMPNNVYTKPRSISTLCRTLSDSSSEEGYALSLKLSPVKLQRSKSSYTQQTATKNQTSASKLQFMDVPSTDSRSSSASFRSVRNRRDLRRPATHNAVVRGRYTAHPAWTEFITHIKALEQEYDTLEARVNSGANVKKITGRKNGLLDLPASRQFLRVMKELIAQRKKQLKDEIKRQKAAGKIEDVKLMLQKAADTIGDHSDSDESEASDIERKRALVAAAKHGWDMIRRSVKEMGFQRRAQDLTRFNWTFLRQAISNMANSSRARRELYDQYLLYPDEWINNFQMKLPESFTRLHQHHLWRRAVRRPQTSVDVYTQQHLPDIHQSKNGQQQHKRNKRSRPKTSL